MRFAAAGGGCDGTNVVAGGDRCTVFTSLAEGPSVGIRGVTGSVGLICAIAGCPRGCCGRSNAGVNCCEGRECEFCVECFCGSKRPAGSKMVPGELTATGRLREIMKSSICRACAGSRYTGRAGMPC